MRKKCLIFISIGDDLQRFVFSGAFADLTQNYDCKYVFFNQNGSPLIKLSFSSITEPVLFVDYDENRFFKWTEYFDASCYFYRDSNPSFRIRYEMKKLGHCKLTWPSVSPTNPKSVVLFPKHLLQNYLVLRKWVNYYRQIEDSINKVGYEQYKKNFIQDMPVHKGISDLLQGERPDFIVIPSSLVDMTTNDILQAASSQNVPSILLQSGWDNISSKGMLFFEPAIFGVWGEQSKEHAISVQRIPGSKVIPIGVPHYEQFRKAGGHINLRKDLNLSPDVKIILFGGSFRQFDETGILRNLDNAIERGEFGKVHIIYRPHPWRAPRIEEDFFSVDWRHVSMDPAMAEIYKISKQSGMQTGNEFAYSMEYLHSLLISVNAVVSPMSTLILEALLNHKPVLALAFNDGKHRWSADKTSKMLHFQDLREAKSVVWCKEQNCFKASLIELIKLADIKSTGIEASLKDIIHQDELSYSGRLFKLVHNLIN